MRYNGFSVALRQGANGHNSHRRVADVALQVRGFELGVQQSAGGVPKFMQHGLK
jgi:hypothetical protein